MRGGSGGGAITVEVCAQPVTLSTSALSITARSINAGLAIAGLLVETGLPGCLLGTECRLGGGGLLADPRQHGGVVGVHGLFSRFDPARVPSGRQGDGCAQGHGGSNGFDLPNHFQHTHHIQGVHIM